MSPLAPAGPGDPIGGPGAPARWDVVVLGAGNAALVAALSAREQGASVLVLERAPVWQRGGNTRHTRNIRCAHDAGDGFVTGAYPAEELYADLCGVGSGPGDEQLARLTVAASAHVPSWMERQGVAWQRPLTGTLQLGRTNRFFLGGGKALVNRYVETALRKGVKIAYDAKATGFVADGRRVEHVEVETAAGRERVACASVVCAAGGFEANLEWLGRYWGAAAENYIVRGPEHNDGTVLRALYDLGAEPAGEERGFHAVAVDARSPRYDGGIATRLDSIPFGVVVNRGARRFADEGEDLWPKRYASWGSKIALQDGQIAYAIWDARAAGDFLPPMYPPVRADTVAELGLGLGLDPETLEAELNGYNDAVREGTFDPTLLDDCSTAGLDPPKSHWARRIDTPPYYGLAMRPGITFTYLGVAVDADARVRTADGATLDNVFAAGEIMSGNILTSGYLAGFGLTIGAVWGRIAGSRAASAALGPG